MNIKIQSVHFSADKQLKEFISKKLEKLVSIDDNIINANIYLKIDKPESFDNKIVEIKLHSSLGEYFAKKQANSFEESIDLASQALKKQILKNK
jgi:putative sigma-54 modulation protein